MFLRGDDFMVSDCWGSAIGAGELYLKRRREAVRETVTPSGSNKHFCTRQLHCLRHVFTYDKMSKMYYMVVFVVLIITPKNTRTVLSLAFYSMRHMFALKPAAGSMNRMSRGR